MTIQPSRSFRVSSVCFLIFVGALMAGIGGYAIYLGQIAPGLVFIAVFGFFLWLARAGWMARLYADGTWVGRTMPWPKRCKQADLQLIRMTGPVAPSWEFMLADGEVAFRVSPLLFPLPAMTTFGEHLGVPINVGRPNQRRG